MVPIYCTSIIHCIPTVHSGNLDEYTPEPSGGISTGAVVGIVMAGIVLGALALAVTGLITYLILHRNWGEHTPLIPGRLVASSAIELGTVAYRSDRLIVC